MGTIRARCVLEHPSFVLEALCDREPDRIATDLPGARVADPAALFESDLDAVMIATPNQVTAGLVTAALERGKHVFCEKPPGRSVAELRAIAEAEAKTRDLSLKLKFGFNHRYHGSIRETKALLEGGRLGPLLWMRGVYGKSGEAPDSWRARRELAGGGILLDQGIHMLDLFRYLGGEFESVKSTVTTAYWDLDVEDNAFAILRARAGHVATLHSSSTLWRHQFTLDVGVGEGYLSIGGILTSTRSYGDETLRIGRRNPDDETAAFGKPKEEIVYFDRDQSWELEVDEFARCILDEEPVRIGSSRDALATMELVERIYEDGRRPGLPIAAEDDLHSVAARHGAAAR